MRFENKNSIKGMDLRSALSLAIKLGFHVRDIQGTGEILVSHPYFPKRIRINARRKDCPRALSCRIGQMLRGQDN